MTRGLARAAVPLTILLVSAAGCRPRPAGREVPVVQPGAPGQDTRVLSRQSMKTAPQRGVAAADVKFVREMIGHHQQALEMTRLLATRSSDPDMKKLALRIELSQADEIKMMREWLAGHGQQAPDAHAHHAAGALMPGMLTADEMARLAAASGRDFDRLFLEYMIKHHAGALTMVRQLFDTAGAAQDADIFAFAADVEADQRMEIDRMNLMLRERQK